jgi:hypothetical protein
MLDTLAIYGMLGSPLIIGIAMWIKPGLGCLMGALTVGAAYIVLHLNESSGWLVIFALPLLFVSFCLVLWDINRLMKWLTQREAKRER